MAARPRTTAPTIRKGKAEAKAAASPFCGDLGSLCKTGAPKGRKAWGNRSAFTPALSEMRSCLQEGYSLKMFSTESFRNMTRFPIITWHTSSCNWATEKNGVSGMPRLCRSPLTWGTTGQVRRAGREAVAPPTPAISARAGIQRGVPETPWGLQVAHKSELGSAAPGRGSCCEGPAEAKK